MSAQRPRLSAEDILAAFNDRGVRYVLIGAFAAIAQGAPIGATYDIDVTPQRGSVNLERLSRALSDLDARVRVDDLEEGLPFSHDARSLARMDMLNLTCAAGDFDIVFSPAETRTSGFCPSYGDSYVTALTRPPHPTDPPVHDIPARIVIRRSRGFCGRQRRRRLHLT